MILADTSVWVDHFRRGNAHFHQCLEVRKILIHPFVLGEIACGNLLSRQKVLADLTALPVATCAGFDEVLNLLDQHRLFGKGLSWIDAHLLGSARLSGCPLWTIDKPLGLAAARLRVGYSYVS